MAQKRRIPYTGNGYGSNNFKSKLLLSVRLVFDAELGWLTIEALVILLIKKQLYEVKLLERKLYFSIMKTVKTVEHLPS